ncbi:hypothetical protein HPT25_06140 [Bacillus sp. BRMEA1]|uniref:hypothetical protein n=1 Tax=Neobacillus endophyticus TaxID=2738405 RepID=UPI0015635EDC|nr:hypothetical protein [Neobacillus endophyticus]NRD77076.1 hypothetical protein [Neobacillus endophyticus]
MNAYAAFFILFIPVLLIYGTIQYFSFKNWTSVYIALNDDSYFQAISKLKQAGVRYKIKSSFDQTSTPMFGGNRQRHYEIYVKEKDAHYASQQLYS